MSAFLIAITSRRPRHRQITSSSETPVSKTSRLNPRLIGRKETDLGVVEKEDCREAAPTVPINKGDSSTTKFHRVKDSTSTTSRSQTSRWWRSRRHMAQIQIIEVDRATTWWAIWIRLKTIKTSNLFNRLSMTLEEKWWRLGRSRAKTRIDNSREEVDRETRDD